MNKQLKAQRVAATIAVVWMMLWIPCPSVGSPKKAPQKLFVAVAQPLVEPGAIDENISRMEPLVKQAARQGAQLVVFSECGITGWDLKGFGANVAITLEHPALNKVAEMARCHEIVIIAGFHEQRGDQLHNTAAVFFPDGRRVVQRKHLVLKLEKSIAPVVSAPEKRAVFEVDGFRCAVLICSDAGIQGIFAKLAASGCDAVILITAGGGDTKLGVHQTELTDEQIRKKVARQSAACLAPQTIEQCLRLDCAQIACNQSGWSAKRGYFQIGGSSIINRTGEVTAVIPPKCVFEQLRPQLAVGFVTRRTIGR